MMTSDVYKRREYSAITNMENEKRATIRHLKNTRRFYLAISSQ